MSGLPVNTFSQAAEYRKRYLATLALSAQNDAYNLQANQVYKQTGQPSRPSDTRTTTEKLADVEKLKVDLRAGLMQLTDGTQANETIEQLTPDEVQFATQQLPAIIAELKPKFARGVPAQALIAYIRALRRKFLATSGVSFTAQEATAQQILNAIQAGVNMMGSSGGPFSTTTGTTPSTPSTIDSYPSTPGNEFPPISPQPIGEITTPVRPMPIRPSPTRPPSGLPISSFEQPEMEQEMQQEIQERGTIAQFKNDPVYQQAARNFGPSTEEEWDEYPTPGGFEPYPDSTPIAVQFLKWWAMAQPVEIQLKFQPGWKRKTTLPELKIALQPGVEEKLGLNQLQQPELDVFEEESTMTTAPTGTTEQETRTSGIPSSAVFLERIGNPRFSNAQMTKDVEAFLIQNNLLNSLVRTMDGLKTQPKRIAYSGNTSASRPFEVDDTNLIDLIRQVRGRGMVVKRAKEPASRYPTGREILGYGLKKKQPIQIDMNKGLAYNSSPTYVPFGKYIINPSKLSSGIMEIKTLKGGNVAKHPARQLSPSLTKIMNRIVGGRMPDEYDFNEMDLEDQNYLFNLAKDAKISDRLNLPTPKRTKDDEEENRFEILKGQIIAGNDNKDLVKEFKKMLVKFSDDGRIKKSEARELLLDLTALGH